MYFGYTFCPEVCPTTLTDLTQWMQTLGPDADKLHYVFVTVDPERDTPKVMLAIIVLIPVVNVPRHLLALLVWPFRSLTMNTQFNRRHTAKLPSY
jgi:hypothetical protein